MGLELFKKIEVKNNKIVIHINTSLQGVCQSLLAKVKYQNKYTVKDGSNSNIDMIIDKVDILSISIKALQVNTCEIDYPALVTTTAKTNPTWLHSLEPHKTINKI